MSWTLGLRAGLVESNYPTKLCNSDEKWLGIFWKVPLTIFKAKKWIESALKGGFNAHNSYKITPKDHISDLKL